MTNEEAINKLKDAIAITEYIDEAYVDIIDLEVVKMAVEALEKQIPKKVQRFRFTTDISCPYCGNTVFYKYCADCGQRLDWEKE